MFKSSEPLNDMKSNPIQISSFTAGREAPVVLSGFSPLKNRSPPSKQTAQPDTYGSFSHQIQKAQHNLPSFQLSVKPTVQKKDSSLNTTTLFARNVFELNHTNTLSKTKSKQKYEALNRTAPAQAEPDKAGVKGKRHSVLYHEPELRPYLSNKQSKQVTGNDFFSEELKAKSDLVKQRVTNYQDYKTIMAGLRDDKRVKLRGASPPSSSHVSPREQPLTVFERFKNLSLFKEPVTKLEKDPYEVNNIHMKSRREKLYSKNVFKANVKVLSRPGSAFQSAKSSTQHRAKGLNESLELNIANNTIKEHTVYPRQERSRTTDKAVHGHTG